MEGLVWEDEIDSLVGIVDQQVQRLADELAAIIDIRIGKAPIGDDEAHHVARRVTVLRPEGVLALREGERLEVDRGLEIVVERDRRGALRHGDLRSIITRRLVRIRRVTNLDAHIDREAGTAERLIRDPEVTILERRNSSECTHQRSGLIGEGIHVAVERQLHHRVFGGVARRYREVELEPRDRHVDQVIADGIVPDAQGQNRRGAGCTALIGQLLGDLIVGSRSAAQSLGDRASFAAL